MTDIDRQQAAGAFLMLLDEAARRVGDSWFLLRYSTLGATAPQETYRERVYCYELYHQIRVLSDTKLGEAAGAPTYLLSGEIDKAGLRAVTDKGLHKPDLLWHEPGSWQRNAVVVEVKTASGLTTDGLSKDLQTLSAFVDADERGYECGVLLVYGDMAEKELHANVLRVAVDLQRTPDPQTPGKARLSEHARRRIHLLLHPKAGRGTKNLGTLER